jgi:leucyl-tRNA synthetase
VTGEATGEQCRALHAMLKKVGEDVEGLRFNTAISAMMEFVNEAYKWERHPQALLEPFLLALSPFAPHLAEELWSKLGHVRVSPMSPGRCMTRRCWSPTPWKWWCR